METSSSSDPSNASHLFWDKQWDGIPQAWEQVGSEQPFCSERSPLRCRAFPMHRDGWGELLGPRARDKWSCSPVWGSPVQR